MSIKSDRWIRRMAAEHGMIEPFVEKQTREGMISFGLSSYGYDARVGHEFKIFTNVESAIVDPKAELGSGVKIGVSRSVCKVWLRQASPGPLVWRVGKSGLPWRWSRAAGRFG